LAVLYLLRLTRGADPRLWLAVGAALGVSALSKYSVAYFVAALILSGRSEGATLPGREETFPG